MDIKISEKIKTYEVEIISVNSEVRDFRFVIEIYRNVSDKDTFFPKVYRKETFRIQPTFPQNSLGIPSGESADEEIIVEDIVEFWETITGKTVDEVLNNVLYKIRLIFSAEPV